MVTENATAVDLLVSRHFNVNYIPRIKAVAVVVDFFSRFKFPMIVRNHSSVYLLEQLISQVLDLSWMTKRKDLVVSYVGFFLDVFLNSGWLIKIVMKRSMIWLKYLPAFSKQRFMPR